LQDVLIQPAIQHGQPVAWFAPIYRDLAENWRDVVHVLGPIIKSANTTDKRIELITGGVIDMWSLDDRDSGRGRKYQRVVINEASKVKDLQYSWEYVIRSTLADFGGDAWIGGTPKGFNYFATLCNQLAERKDGRAHHYTTYDNPHIARTEIEDLRLTLPDRVFRQEILAEFIADGSYFQNVDQCAIIESPDAPGDHPNHALFIGVDWAKQNDFTVITVGCRDCNRVVDWLRFNQIDYRLQRERLINMINRWGQCYTLVESNSIGEPMLEELQYSGYVVDGFETTATSKPGLIESLNSAMVMSGFQVPREYGEELRAYEIISNSGKTRFGAPAGMHDDMVISAALCWRAMTNAMPLVF